MKPKVSIIIPVYNKDIYLEDCFESILAQTWKELEVIIVDDGSTDSSGRIIDDYVKKDSRFHAMNAGHKGPSAARNMGMEVASGEYLTFLDADDFIEPDYIRNLVTGIKGVDLCISGFKTWDQEQDSWRVFSCSFADYTADQINHSILKYCDILGGVGWRLYRTAMLRNNNICFLEDISYGEDTILFFQYLFSIHKMRMICDTGYVYRKHDKQSLTRKADLQINTIEQFIMKLEDLSAQLCHENFRSIIAHWQFLHMWHIGKQVCYQIRGYRNRKQRFYEIAKKNHLLDKCLHIKPITKGVLAVQLSLITHCFWPLNLSVMIVGKIRHWDKEYIYVNSSIFSH